MNRELAAINHYNAAIDYSEVFAEFVGDFSDLRGADPTPECLHPDPEKSYPAGNRLADEVRAQGEVIRFTWSGTPNPQIGAMT